MVDERSKVCSAICSVFSGKRPAKVVPGLDHIITSPYDFSYFKVISKGAVLAADKLTYSLHSLKEAYTVYIIYY